MKVLVTGGAGYLGSTVASAFEDAGESVVLLDNLHSGCRSFIGAHPSYVGDVADRQLLHRIFTDHPDITLTIHCAARTAVPESLTDPLTYYRENLGKTLALVEALLTNRCPRLLFSSSAAVYGSERTDAAREDDTLHPETPYAVAKSTVERILDDVCRSEPLRALSLRYFNPIGGDPLLRSGPHDTQFQPVLGAMLTASAAQRPFCIHGNDWPTRDGTPVRDFVDAWDLARAHVAAARRWQAAGSPHESVNIGSGQATTVAELARLVSDELPAALHIEYDARRPGDAAGCAAVIDKAQQLFGWRPQRSVRDAVRTAVRWHSSDHRC
jgi:UDP-glucose 4-epimerase